MNSFSTNIRGTIGYDPDIRNGHFEIESGDYSKVLTTAKNAIDILYDNGQDINVCLQLKVECNNLTVSAFIKDVFKSTDLLIEHVDQAVLKLKNKWKGLYGNLLER